MFSQFIRDAFTSKTRRERERETSVIRFSLSSQTLSLSQVSKVTTAVVVVVGIFAPNHETASSLGFGYFISWQLQVFNDGEANEAEPVCYCADPSPSPRTASSQCQYRIHPNEQQDLHNRMQAILKRRKEGKK